MAGHTGDICLKFEEYTAIGFEVTSISIFKKKFKAPPSGPVMLKIIFLYTIQCIWSCSLRISMSQHFSYKREKVIAKKRVLKILHNLYTPPSGTITPKNLKFIYHLKRLIHGKMISHVATS